MIILFILLNTFQLSPGIPTPQHCGKPLNYTLQNVLPFEKVLPQFRNMEFNIRKEIYHRTAELAKEIEKGTSKKPFKKIIRANLAVTHAQGMKPNTYLRQLIAAVSYPPLMETAKFPSDIVKRGKELLKELHGGSIGSMSYPSGLESVRRNVAKYLEQRDGIPTNYENVIITDAVSGGVGLAFKLLQNSCQDDKTGILVPVPLYALFDARPLEFGLEKILYHQRQEKDWAIDVKELERAYDEGICSCNCRPRALVIINPGNPTGQVCTQHELELIVKFSRDRGLIILSDEIYQNELLFEEERPFISMKKVIHSMPYPYNQTELLSFHSVSKGYIGEAGLRGGFMELYNIDGRINDLMFKLMSVQMCTNIIGQICVDALVNPPKPNDESYSLYMKEKNGFHNEHVELSRKLTQGLNSIPGFNQSKIYGGAVAFPKITVPQKARVEAKSKGLHPDVFYGMELLEETGISVAAGTAFNMDSDGDAFLRITTPISAELLDELLTTLKSFNAKFLAKYS